MNMYPTTEVITSLKIKINQKYFNPNLENIYHKGTNKITFQTPVNKELLIGQLTAWKNTG